METRTETSPRATRFLTSTEIFRREKATRTTLLKTSANLDVVLSYFLEIKVALTMSWFPGLSGNSQNGGPRSESASDFWGRELQIGKCLTLVHMGMKDLAIRLLS